MPPCSECNMLGNNTCKAYEQAAQTLGRPVPPPPIGACEIPIVENYLHRIQPGMNVLDIGCGTWNRIKSYCERVGANYEGIDAQEYYYGKKTIATRLENLADLSFPDNTFDLVIANQTMEHWAENGCRLSWGLYQCFRVCKPDGWVLINVPFHYHGTKTFLLGEPDTLRSLFADFSTDVQFYKWGNPSSPLPEYFPHPGYRTLKNKPAYMLDIHARKNRPLPEGYHNRYATRGRLAELLNYPFSYTVYRTLRKAKLYSANAEVKYPTC